MAFSFNQASDEIVADGKAIIGGFDFMAILINRELKIGQEDIILKESALANGSDDCGEYLGIKKHFVQDYIDKKGRHWEWSSVWLEVRCYEDFFCVGAGCKVKDSLKHDGHLRVEIGSVPQLKEALALYMYSDWWTRPWFGANLAELPMRVNMVLWRREDGDYVCLLPLVDGDSSCQFNGRTGKLGVDAALHDYGHSISDCKMFVGSIGDNPYKLIAHCVEKAMRLLGNSGKLRWEKPYPEIFEYVGWCTWNALYQKVNESDIFKKMEHAKAAGFNFGWVLVDDGWSPLIDRELAGFDADEAKFPRGLAAFVADMKDKYNVKEVGVWQAYTGYWGGIAKESDICKENKQFILNTKRDTRIPYPDVAKGFGFWNAWHSELKKQGIGFVKVDNQGAVRHHTLGILPIGRAGRELQYALQASVGLNFNQRIINCMCMALECAWFWTASNVSRNSDDFFPDILDSGPEHARQNIYNALLYSNFSWPDWDMWWTHHDLADYHGALRAISGGPVYVADEIDKGDYSKLAPLVLSNGRILRCQQPALPTRDSLFVDPENNALAVKCFNIANGCGYVLAVNAASHNCVVSGCMSPSDVEGLDGDEFAVREYFSGEARKMRFDDAWNFELGPNGVKLFLVSPMTNGFAPFGLIDKYISSAAVVSVCAAEDCIAIALAEGGKFSCWIDFDIKAAFCDAKPVQYTQSGNVATIEIWGKGQKTVYLKR